MENSWKNAKRFLSTDYNILVADPEEGERGEMKKLLFEYGVSVDEADSTEMALKLAYEHRYDMIFVGGGLVGIEHDELVGGVSGDCGIVTMPQNGAELQTLLSQTIPEERRQYIAEEEREGSAADMKVVRMFMSGVDVVSGIQKNGKLEDYMDLLDLFHMDGQQRRGSLAEKIEKKDFANYVIEVHGLKSAAANIGADTLSALAKQHEFSGNESKFDYIEENQGELFACYEKVLAEIERVLKKSEYGRFAVKEEEAMPAIEEAEIPERLREILHQVETFHSKDAAQGVEELLKYSIPATVRTALEEVQALLKMYEDDKAEEALRAMLNQE